MLSPQVRRQWAQRLKAAALRYEIAKDRVRETAIERLYLPRPDGYYAHSLALTEETESLRDYRNLLTEYAWLMNSLSSEP